MRRSSTLFVLLAPVLAFATQNGVPEDSLRLLRTVDAALAREPERVDLLQARLLVVLARRANDDAARTAGRLASAAPPGLLRRAARALAASLDRQRNASAHRRLVEELAVQRRRGEPKRILVLARELERRRPGDVLGPYARGAVHGSFGGSFDPKKAVAAWRRALDLIDAGADPASVQRFTGRAPTPAGLRRAILAGIARLAAGQPIDPPPVIDRAAWTKRRSSVRASLERAGRHERAIRRRIERLQAQLETVGHLKRKDGWSNRLTIRWDVQRNERELARIADRVAALRRDERRIEATLRRLERPNASSR